jgi:hypothetical protein
MRWCLASLRLATGLRDPEDSRVAAVLFLPSARDRLIKRGRRALCWQLTWAASYRTITDQRKREKGSFGTPLGGL